MSNTVFGAALIVVSVLYAKSAMVPSLRRSRGSGTRAMASGISAQEPPPSSANQRDHRRSVAQVDYPPGRHGQHGPLVKGHPTHARSGWIRWLRRVAPTDERAPGVDGSACDAQPTLLLS